QTAAHPVVVAGRPPAAAAGHPAARAVFGGDDDPAARIWRRADASARARGCALLARRCLLTRAGVGGQKLAFCSSQLAAGSRQHDRRRAGRSADAVRTTDGESSMHDYEKLGLFYLGRLHDPDTGTPRDELLLYDARDLVTHAVCVGMTGSGKTGLCIDLLEEAALDGIPAIVIDPKGDLGNLLLTFPALSAAEFRPWIDEDEARRHGQSPDEFAASQAALWREGLERWHQPPDRIARFRAAADAVIYTPGSEAGIPLSVLRSFAAPP